MHIYILLANIVYTYIDVVSVLPAKTVQQSNSPTVQLSNFPCLSVFSIVFVFDSILLSKEYTIIVSIHYLRIKFLIWTKTMITTIYEKET